jgi:hypothetical protein
MRRLRGDLSLLTVDALVHVATSTGPASWRFDDGAYRWTLDPAIPAAIARSTADLLADASRRGFNSIALERFGGEAWSDLREVLNEQASVSEVWLLAVEEVVPGMQADIVGDEKGQLLRSRMRSILDDLPAEDRHVISLRFGLDDGVPQSLEAVARRTGLSADRIKQIQGMAMLKLAGRTP